MHRIEYSREKGIERRECCSLFSRYHYYCCSSISCSSTGSGRENKRKPHELLLLLFCCWSVIEYTHTVHISLVFFFSFCFQFFSFFPTPSCTYNTDCNDGPTGYSYIASFNLSALTRLAAPPSLDVIIIGSICICAGSRLVRERFYLFLTNNSNSIASHAHRSMLNGLGYVRQNDDDSLAFFYSSTFAHVLLSSLESIHRKIREISELTRKGQKTKEEYGEGSHQQLCAI